MTGPLCARVSLAVGLLLSEEPAAGTTRDRLDEVAAGLAEPLRVAVAGRVNAGKSTLVNALLRQRVAPVGVSECTRLVTWYRFGVPERVEVVCRDGEIVRHPIRDDGTMPVTLGVEFERIDHLDVFVSNEALHDVVLIDTPGLSSLNDQYSQSTRELIGIDESSRLAVGKADAVLFVMTTAVRRDEVDAIETYNAIFDGLGATALNTIGVLNKADLVGTGTGDPRVAAAELARRTSERLRHAMTGVVPLVGLLAETADGGRFTERDAALLREIAALEPARRTALLRSADRFVASAGPGNPEDRARILETLDLWGIERALETIARGTTRTSELVAELRALSGIARLRGTVAETFERNADALKASWALAALERVASLPELDDARRRRLRNEIEAIRLDPRMHRLSEIRALQEWAAQVVELPVDWGQRLYRLVTADRPATRFGLDEDAAREAVRNAALSEAAAWKAFGNDSRATPRQRWLADVACRSCEQLWLESAQAVS